MNTVAFRYKDDLVLIHSSLNNTPQPLIDAVPGTKAVTVQESFEVLPFQAAKRIGISVFSVPRYVPYCDHAPLDISTTTQFKWASSWRCPNKCRPSEAWLEWQQDKATLNEMHRKYREYRELHHSDFAVIHQQNLDAAVKLASNE